MVKEIFGAENWVKDIAMHKQTSKNKYTHIDWATRKKEKHKTFQ